MKKSIIKLVLTFIAAFVFLTPLSYGYKVNKQEITVASAGGDVIVPWSHLNSFTKQDSVSFFVGCEKAVVP